MASTIHQQPQLGAANFIKPFRIMDVHTVDERENVNRTLVVRNVHDRGEETWMHYSEPLKNTPSIYDLGDPCLSPLTEKQTWSSTAYPEFRGVRGAEEFWHCAIMALSALGSQPNIKIRHLVFNISQFVPTDLDSLEHGVKGAIILAQFNNAYLESIQFAFWAQFDDAEPKPRNAAVFVATQFNRCARFNWAIVETSSVSFVADERMSVRKATFKLVEDASSIADSVSLPPHNAVHFSLTKEKLLDQENDPVSVKAREIYAAYDLEWQKKFAAVMLTKE